MAASRSGLPDNESSALFADRTIILGIIIIGLMGLVTDMLFKLAYRRMFRWMDRKG